MKSTIKTKINRFLKFLGFNVVKAKRARKPSAAKCGVTTSPPSPFKSTEDIRNSCKTHFVGDDCPGGHSNCDPETGAKL